MLYSNNDKKNKCSYFYSHLHIYRKIRRLWNHLMVWVDRDLRDHLVPIPLPLPGTPCIRSGCSEPHPSWPWTLQVWVITASVPVPKGWVCFCSFCVWGTNKRFTLLFSGWVWPVQNEDFVGIAACTDHSGSLTLVTQLLVCRLES